MSERSYHHGNLKQAMVEEAIKIISHEGLKGLSMRKVANQCKVSHAAPYNHFKDKAELIKTIEHHITTDFCAYLENVIVSYKDSEQLLVELGFHYVKYFMTHKPYYRFLFLHYNFHVIIEEDFISCDDFNAFTLYKNCAITYMKKHSIKEEYYTMNILSAWAIVEGLTSIFVSDNTVCKANTDLLIRRILTEKFKLS